MEREYFEPRRGGTSNLFVAGARQSFLLLNVNCREWAVNLWNENPRFQYLFLLLVPYIFHFLFLKKELLEGTHGDDINNPLPRSTNNSIRPRNN